VADRVYRELEANGYEPQLHERTDEDGVFDLRLRGHDFDLGDFKTMVQVGERFGLGLALDDSGWITLR